MGVKSFWQFISGANLIQQWNGQNPTDVPAIAAEMEGKVIAVDLSMWVMQAAGNQELLQHCNQEEAAAKVAFERVIHWLRFGITPVFVIEGLAPAAKHDVQHRRLYGIAAAGGGSYGGGAAAGGGGIRTTPNTARRNAYNNVAAASMGPTQFIRTSQQVAAILEAMGLPVIQAPGEAEATCAALCSSDIVDGVASFDGDTLLFGAETVYPVVKLSTTQEKTCTLTKLSLEQVRNHLGLTAPGSGRHALALFAMLCGCDYDESGAHGIGGVGAMALIKKLLIGCTDDSTILNRFEDMLYSGPDTTLQGVVKCTGCAQCKHEGGKTGKIKSHHPTKNPCPCCEAQILLGYHPDGHCTVATHGCIPQNGECQCTFHRRANDRVAERVAAKARAEPNILKRARDAAALYFQGSEEASAAVKKEIRSRNLMPGQKLSWMHRPRVKSVHQAITSLQQKSGLTVGGAFDWDQSTLRAKMMPLLIEWDLRNRNRPVEFLPRLIKKIQGNGAVAGWRYLVEFNRAVGVDMESFDSSLRPLKKNTSAAGVAAAADLLLSADQTDEETFLFTNNEYLRGEGYDDFSTQRPVQHADGINIAIFDKEWLDSDVGKNHRGVRMSLIREKWPELETAFLEKSRRRGGTGMKERRHAVVSSPAAKGRNTTTGTTPVQCNQQTPYRPAQLNSLDRHLVQRQQQREDDEDSPGRMSDAILREDGGDGEYDGYRVVKKKQQQQRGDGNDSGSRRGVLGGGVPFSTIGAAAAGGQFERKKKQQEPPQESPNDDDFYGSTSPLKRPRSTPTAPRSSTPAGSTVLPSGRVIPESEGLKTIRALKIRRDARLAAEKLRYEAMTEEERVARKEHVRQRGGDLGRLFGSSGTPAAGAGVEEKVEEKGKKHEEDNEVIDLVTPASSSASEDEEGPEEEEQWPTSSPPPRRRNPSRTVVIDLTLDDSE